MRRYAVAGLTLASDVALPELPELPEAEGGTHADWTFETLAGWPEEPLKGAGHETLDAAGEIWRMLHLEGERLVLSFPHTANFVVLAAERRLLCAPAEGAEEGLLRHLLLDQVIPHALAMEGWLILHASAVATSDGAVAFLGPSGAGKSSLAASFAAEGFALLSDDFVPLRRSHGRFVATPSYPGLRLWPDSREFFAELGDPSGPVAEGTEKRRIPAPEQMPPDSLPLLALIVLAEEEPEPELACTLAPVMPRERFLAVFEHGFRLGQLERERQLAEFELYASLAGSTEVLRLEYRWDYDLLAAIRSKILETLAVGSGR